MEAAIRTFDSYSQHTQSYILTSNIEKRADRGEYFHYTCISEKLQSRISTFSGVIFSGVVLGDFSYVTIAVHPDDIEACDKEFKEEVSQGFVRIESECIQLLS